MGCFTAWLPSRLQRTWEHGQGHSSVWNPSFVLPYTRILKPAAVASPDFKTAYLSGRKRIRAPFILLSPLLTFALPREFLSLRMRVDW